jgi:membrane protease YdiL (CAAX protease family)
MAWLTSPALGEGSINMTADDASRQSTSPQEGLLARHPLVFFFLMAYAFSWIAWAPWVLSEEGAGLLPFSSPLLAPALPIGIFLGPTLAAFIMTAATEGRAGIRRLLRRIVLWRVGLGWYLFAFIGVPLVMTLGTIIVPGGLASMQFLGPGYVLTYLVTFIFVLLIGGPLGEEIGWRGFALPRMQPLHGPLVGSIILGLLWALWHLPEFLVPTWAASSGGTSPIAIVKFCIFAIAITIILTWVFNNTKGSVLMAILVHASIDAPFLPFSVLLGPSEVMNSMLVGFGALALVVVALTRGRLGYEHYQQEVEEPAPATAPT